MAQKPGRSAGGVVKNWFGRLLLKAAGIGLSLTDPKGWKTLGGGTYTGKSVDENTAMQVSAVWACVRILAESIGQLPWGVYQRQRNGNMIKVDHDLGTILVETPNADMTSVEFREAVQSNLGLQGNGYSLRNVNGAGNVSSLYPVPSSEMIPQRDRYTREISYRFYDRGQWEVLPREKVWHLRGFGTNGLVGYSPIGYMRQAMGLAMAAEEFGANVFARGAHPSLIVKIPEWLDDNQREKAQKNLDDLYAGLKNAHKPMMLEGGMALDAGGAIMQPEDLQLLELRRFQLHEIARIWGVPPHMLADMERATFSNIEEMSLGFVMFTLLPWLRRWEDSATRWLLKPAERKSLRVMFNFDGLLRANTQARAEYLRTMVANGLMSRNEARAKENMNLVEGKGMDDYTVQSNMISVDELAAVAAAMKKNKSAPDWASNMSDWRAVA